MPRPAVSNRRFPPRALHAIRSLACLALATALLLASAPQALAQRGNPGMSFAGQSVDEMIARFMQEYGVPGMAVAIVQAPYIPRVTGYGLADRETRALSASNTLFGLGQFEQAVLCVALAQLAQAGKLDLTRPLGQLLPGLPQAWQGVTPRQAMAHTSGIPDYRQAPTFDPARTLMPREALDLAATLPPAFAPGGGAMNSATDTVLLKLLVEKASGQPWREYLRLGQFMRLGLAQTRFAGDADTPPAEKLTPGGRHSEFLKDPRLINPTEMATGYHPTPGGAASSAAAGQPSPRASTPPATAPAARPGDLLMASAMDVSFWDIGLAGSILVADPALRASLYAPVRLADGSAAPVNGAWRFPGRKGLMYVTGDAHGFSAFLSRFTDPSELVCVTLLANREGLDLSQLARRIAGAYDPRLRPPDAPGLRVQQSPYPVQETLKRFGSLLSLSGFTLPEKQAAAKVPAGVPRQASWLAFKGEGGPALRGYAWEDSAGQVWLAVADPAARQGSGQAGPESKEMVLRMRIDRALLGAVTPY